MTSLKVYPIRFSRNVKKVMENANEVGRGFMQARDSKLLAHTGWAFVLEQNETNFVFVSGDVVIDFKETFKAHPDWKPVRKLPSARYRRGRINQGTVECLAVCYWTEGQELKEFQTTTVCWIEDNIPHFTKREYCCYHDPFLSGMTSSDSFEYLPREEDLHLLPSRLFGYSLQDRRFVACDVKNLRRIEKDRDMFNNLIINQNHEAILRALVESHFIPKEINETRVILLHGVPGVGKTSTAETIASHFQKPLFPITCGDLGLDPATVEKSLKEMFRVAQLWDCIPLLDEADVFLSERVPSDLGRNALFSSASWTTTPELLFLTTNRVGTIDEAFKFRIHILLYYPYLDLVQTEKIWEVNLDRLATIEEEHGGGRKPLSIDRDGILAFAKKHFTKSKNGKGRWNGRQIRNAFLIASALAHYERTHNIKQNGNVCDLNAHHFKTVVKAGTRFEKYLLVTRGMTDQQAAFLNCTRADHVQSPETVNASRAADPASVQPAKPLVYPGWVNQYPSQSSFAPPQAQAEYNLAAGPPPVTSLYQQPQQPQYVL
ncbi:P-loop containing nucleoside triphosphate hydrolase protein [Aspergillus transmontanensis]|uniref:P-loop containing nucleoside triphosphate hydrolase protein n=1 Tax=Aspergillus transmontanensis TaxID=1034304 RepID=A0A5N6W7I6_9EURO|nr:P-loop containing nucleoside triphosphate hydrolase protein [Aspergillus transmontanensis]